MTAEFKKCWMLKIYTGEDVIVGNDPLYRTILEEARRLKIAGATVIKGIEGYATEVRGIDRRPVSLFTGVSNLPVLVTIVDQKENLEKLIPFLEKKATHALVLFEESTALVTDYMRQVIAKRQADGLENKFALIKNLAAGFTACGFLCPTAYLSAGLSRIFREDCE